MSQQSWRTKEDVIEDLAKVTGRGISRIADDFCVYGERPPPPLECDEGESQCKYFGVSKSKMLNNTSMKPDLQGIVHMIQMVNNYENKIQNKEKPTPTNNIVISKLNPNVAEFVPKIVHSKPSSHCSNDLPANGVHKDTANETKVDNNPRPVSVQDKERDAIAKELKMKITKAADNFQGKKEKNLAIASLLKLHSSKTTTKMEITPPLVTPDYFQRPKPKDISEAGKDSTHYNNNSLPPKTSKLDTPTATSSESMDIEMRNSINKVENWLSKPQIKTETKTKPPVLYLGRVAYKRKDPGPRQSPNSIVQKVSKPTTERCDQYKPSKYADDLVKIYSERNKLKESLEQDLWSKLEKDLKARDEDIRKRMLEKEANDAIVADSADVDINDDTSPLCPHD